MATGSPFWNTARREPATLLFPTLVAAPDEGDVILDRATTAPTSHTFQSAPVGSRWSALEDTASVKAGGTIAIEPEDITSICGLRILVSRGGVTSVAASSRVALVYVDAAESDVRTLPVRLDSRGERACAFSEAVHKMEEHVTHDFPIQGPRTMHWLLLEIAMGDLGLVARHHWWKQAMVLSSSDSGVDEHLFLCETLGHGTQYDQLNLSDLALGEAISRRLQLWEERHAEILLAVSLRIMPRSVIPSWLELDQIGSALVAPDREKWVACQFAEEAAILQERRKGREERELVAAAADPGSRNHRKPK